LEKLDCVVIGGGVVGLSIARALALVGREVILLERNVAIGSETSSRNSEVIHAGIYYPPKSLKAQLCVTGKRLLYEYCTERGIPHKKLGKLIVATSDKHRSQIRQYLTNGAACGVTDLRIVAKDDLFDLEPNIIGLEALWSPSTGIIDSHTLMNSLASDLELNKGLIVRNSPVVGGRIEEAGVRLDVGGNEPVSVLAKLVINTAGLEAQSVAQNLGIKDVPESYFAKGHYFYYGEKNVFSHLVYPVAERGGLGVHVTLDMAGQVRFGPDVSWVSEPNYEFDDSRSLDFLKAIRKYYPSAQAEYLSPGYVGIRPKIVGPGGAFADFQIQTLGAGSSAALINLYGIESPGLTSALAIGEHVRTLIA